MDASSRELDRQKIDKEIQDAVKVVRKLKTRRNTHFLVFRQKFSPTTPVWTISVHSMVHGSNPLSLSVVIGTPLPLHAQLYGVSSFSLRKV
jgi:hypothetical protein